MKTNFKTKQKQLKQLLGEDFDNILISLISKSKVKDEYFEIGDVETDNEHFLKDVLERVVDGCYIDGIKIPFTDYEIKMSGWVDRVNERFIPPNSIPNWNKVENQISEVLGLKIHQFKTELVDVDDDLPF